MKGEERKTTGEDEKGSKQIVKILTRTNRKMIKPLGR